LFHLAPADKHPDALTADFSAVIQYPGKDFKADSLLPRETAEKKPVSFPSATKSKIFTHHDSPCAGKNFEIVSQKLFGGQARKGRGKFNDPCL
jgi:hypothetical protein